MPNITVVDMAQPAGVVDCNLGLNTFDFAVFAGHKTLYGPTGISGFVMNPSVDFPAVIFGGTGYESANQNMPESIPEKYEMGTQNILGIAGLNASLKWILPEAHRDRPAEKTRGESQMTFLYCVPGDAIIGENVQGEKV